MPVIKVQSLPFDPPLSMDEVIARISADFARATGIDEVYVSLVWVWLQPGHYLSGGRFAPNQIASTHPLLVELMVPDFHSAENASRMLQALAEAISAHTGIALRAIFIELRLAHAGMVFDDGAIVEW